MVDEFMDVTMPDGGIIRGVPRGTPKDAIMAKYQKFSPPPLTSGVPDEVPKKQQMRPAAILDRQKPPEDLGFMGRIGQDLQKRVGMAKDIKARAGAQPIGETALQAIGGVGAGLMGDVAGEVYKSAYEQIPLKTREYIESMPPIKAGLDAAKQGALAYVNWANKPEHARFARNLEAAVNIASLFPVPATKIAGKAAETALSPVTNIAKGAIAPGAEKMAKINDAMHKTATATIEKAKNSGVVFHPDTSNEILDSLAKHPDLATAGERSTRPLTSALVDDVTKSINKGDASLKNLLGFRDRLTEIASKGGQDGEAARKARNILDKSIDTGKVAAGDEKAIGLVKEFREQWGRYKTGEQVADATSLADKSPAKSRKAFQKIVDSNYFNSLSPEVQRLTKLAAKGTASGKFLDAIGSLKVLMGSRIPFIGKHLPAAELVTAVATGNIPAAAGISGVMAAEKGGKLTQRKVGADVLRALQENK